MYLLELCFTSDLLLTLNNPLFPAEKRLKRYKIFILISLFAFYFFEFKSIEGSIFNLYKAQSIDQVNELTNYIKQN